MPGALERHRRRLRAAHRGGWCVLLRWPRGGPSTPRRLAGRSRPSSELPALISRVFRNKLTELFKAQRDSVTVRCVGTKPLGALTPVLRLGPIRGHSPSLSFMRVSVFWAFSVTDSAESMNGVLFFNYIFRLIIAGVEMLSV